MTINHVKTKALLDSGNTFESAISLSFAKKLGIKDNELVPLAKRIQLATAEPGGKLKILGKTPTELQFRAGPRNFRFHPIVLEHLNGDINISGPTMSTLRWTWSPSDGAVLDELGNKLKLEAYQEEDKIQHIRLHQDQHEVAVHIAADTVIQPRSVSMVQLVMEPTAPQFWRKGGQVAVLTGRAKISMPPGMEENTFVRPSPLARIVVQTRDGKCQGAWTNPLPQPLTLKQGRYYGALEAVDGGDREPAVKDPLLCQLSYHDDYAARMQQKAKKRETLDFSDMPPPSNLTVEQQRQYIVDRFKLEEADGITSAKELLKVSELLRRYWDKFAWTAEVRIKERSSQTATNLKLNAPLQEVGHTKLVQHRIDLKPGTKPVKTRYRPIPTHLEPSFRKELDQLLGQGIVEPSTSPWAANLVPVVKKQGDIRWCVDVRPSLSYDVYVIMRSDCLSVARPQRGDDPRRVPDALHRDELEHDRRQPLVQ